MRRKERIIKIYTSRKSYEFNPDVFGKKQITVGSDIDNDFWIPELVSYRYMLSKHSKFFSVEIIDEHENNVESVGKLTKDSAHLVLADNNVHVVYLEFGEQSETNYYTLVDIMQSSALTNRVGEITIGSDKSNSDFPSKIMRNKNKLQKSHICINHAALNLVSSQHCILYFNDFGEMWVEDLGSTNGVYVNSFLIDYNDEQKKKKQLRYGDVVDLFSVKIIYLDEYIQVDKVCGNVFTYGLNNMVFSNIEQNQIWIKMPPRRMQPLPNELEKMPNPPSEVNNNSDFVRVLIYMLRPLMWLALPLLASAISPNSSSYGMSITRTSMYIVGPLAMVIMFLRQSKRAKKENEKRFKKYRDKLAGKARLIDDKLKNQEEIYVNTNPNPQENLRRALTLDSRLWAKKAEHSDYLIVRIGTGIASPSFDIEMPSEETLESRPEELVEELELEYEKLKEIENYPIEIDFNQTACIGVVGIYETRTKIILSIMMQLALYHSADEVRFFLVSPQDQLTDYDCLGYLPHIWSVGNSGRMIFTADNKQKDCDGKCFSNKSLEKTCPYCYKQKCFDYYYEEIEKREKQYLDPDSKEKEFTPKLMFFITDLALIEKENSHDLAKFLLNDYSHLGIYCICASELIRNIPVNFKTITTMGFDRGNIEDDSGKNRRFHLDLYTKDNIENISRSLAPVNVESLAMDKKVPNYVTLLDLFNAKSIEELKIIDRWLENYIKPIPEAPVAKIDEKKLLTLNITRKGIGPHGIVGGTTGSGKSEFLLSVILGMAIQCHPDRLGMVVLDYKGGSTAEACKDIPHVHGIVTDLDKGVMTKRALAAIKFEIEHRENLFRDYSNKLGVRIEDLESYFSTVKNGPIIPYLLVIVDELAELKIRENKAMDILEDIARRGRSVGIYLLLTTQNPQGVINAQIQANVNYKICFRISKDNSRGIIDSPDAAYISDSTPGRGLLRVGHNELQVFQSAYTGAEYRETSDNTLEETMPSIFEVDLEGQRHPLYLANTSSLEYKKQSQLNAVVDAVIKTSKDNKIERLKDLWLPVLSNYIKLDEIIGNTNYKGGEWISDDEIDLKAVVGLSDDISNREYKNTIIDFGNEKSHFMIYGPAYSGKTTLLYTIMMSLAYQNSPKSLNMFCFDFSSSPNTSLEKLPHMGNVFVGSNFQHVEEGIVLLKSIVEQRAEIFNENSISNIDEYNIINKNNIMPNIFVFIDNADAMLELKSKALSRFEELLRIGISHGLYFVITGHDRRTIPHEFRRYTDVNNCCLRPDAIQSFELPRGFSMTSQSPGRGIYNGLEFQAAMAVELETEGSVNMKLIKLFENMSANEKGYEIQKSNKVVEKLSEELLDEIAVEQSDTLIPIGQNVSSGKAEYFDINSQSQIMVSYIDSNYGKQMLINLYNRLHSKSNVFRNYEVDVWTEKKDWTDKLINNSKFSIYEYDNTHEKEFDDYIKNIYKDIRDNNTEKLLICDDFGKLINMISMDAYEIMNMMFKDDVFTSKLITLVASDAQSITVWNDKGFVPLQRAIQSQISLIVDGANSEHKWFLRGYKDKEKLKQGYYCTLLNGNRICNLRLIQEDK